MSTANKKMPPIAIGTSDFRKIIEEGSLFVDKSLFIQELIDDHSKAVVLLRPRRFGKTLNLSMAHHFFCAQEASENAHLFKGLNIAKAGELYTKYQGQYPSIFFGLKDIAFTSFEEFLSDFSELMLQLFLRNESMLKKILTRPEYLHPFQSILNRSATKTELQNAPYFLTYLLQEAYGAAAYVFLDEYDAPVMNSRGNSAHDEIFAFVRSMMSKLFKDNTSLKKGIITGVNRISQASLFSGFNNPYIATMLSNKYTTCFGFLPEEVTLLAKQFNLSDKLSAIREWYNGYLAGGHTLYNPWSILNFLHEGGVLKPYWVNTGNYTLLKQILAHAGEQVKKDLMALVAGETLQHSINDNMVLTDLDSPSDEALWTLLWFSGYLKACVVGFEHTKTLCQISLPNLEIKGIYQDIFMEWFKAPTVLQPYQIFLNSVAQGDVALMVHQIETLLKDSASYFDTSGKNPERFYHGLILGMATSLTATHTILSNRESGYGRYDLAILPKDLALPAFVMEFKMVAFRETLETASQKALTQILANEYVQGLKAHHCIKRFAVGLAFEGKTLQAAWQEI